MTHDPLPLPDEVDGVFVGGGHNALIAATYLARAGASVLVLEAGDRLGGGVRTEEVTRPLFKHNLHAFFVRWTPDYTIWHDLDLDRFDVEPIYPRVQNALPYAGGERALLTYRDLGQSLEAIRAVDGDDAERYEQLHAEFSELTNRIIAPLRLAPPLPADERADLLEQSAPGRRLLELSRRSALEVIRENFSSEPLRALIGFNVAVRGYLPVLDEPGTGYCAVLALPNSHEGRIIRGGSGRMIEAITAALYAAGGAAATDAEVASIDVSNGRAVGVTTVDGRSVRARSFVASSVPAPITLLELVGHEHLDPGLADAMRGYRWLGEALFGVHLALAEQPRFRAEAEHPDLPHALNLALGYESSEDLVRDMEAVRDGRLPEVSALHASIPSLHDPSQAPADMHTSFGWQFVPASRDASRPWGREEADRQTESMLAGYARYAPDLRDRILAVRAHSPADTERQVPSMRGGDRHHGSFHPDNWGEDRPHPELSDYRTPLAGLYLCGSSQHPGGSFTGNPGYNAAGVVAEDLGLPRWWDPPDAREVLRSLE